MFDIGFWELVVIGVVALLVIGPERLPAVARTVGIWVGRARRFVSSVQEDISNEINKGEELKRLLQEQSQIKEVHEIIEQTVDETRKTVAISKRALAGNQQSDASGEMVHGDDDGRLSSHQPRSLEDDDEPHSPVKSVQPDSDTSTNSQARASATDAVNDKAK